jgi:hypothetical protein
LLQAYLTLNLQRKFGSGLRLTRDDRNAQKTVAVRTALLHSVYLPNIDMVNPKLPSIL